MKRTIGLLILVFFVSAFMGATLQAQDTGIRSHSLSACLRQSLESDVQINDHDLNWLHLPDALNQKIQHVKPHTPLRSLLSEHDILCGGYYLSPELIPLTPDADEYLQGWADYYQYDVSGQALLCGNVVLRKAGLQIESQAVQLDSPNQKAKLSGRVRVTSQDNLLIGNTAFLNLADDSILLHDAYFLMFAQQARGQAKKIYNVGSNKTRIEQGFYTTCPPGNRDWLLEGRSILLDQELGWGSISHMRFKLGKVPVFYVPYFKFPIDKRRHTGFLYPEIGNLSEPDISFPFYWNLAPQYDWVIKPRKIGGRGILFENEFRYLLYKGNGSLQANYLEEDRSFGDVSRKSFQWKQRQQLGKEWGLQVDLGYVSDNQYLDDFGSGLNTVSESFVERSAKAQYQQGVWFVEANLLAYQTIDQAILKDDLPYRKLPEIIVAHNRSWMQGTLGLLNEVQYAYLEQPESIVAPYAHRFHWRGELRYSTFSSWYFLTPMLQLQQTFYDFNELSDVRSRTVPTFTIDTGLFFERTLPDSWLVSSKKKYIQTLEPRVFHSYTDFREQSDIPVFDTTELTFGFDQLFRPNRFSGVDRIGDTYQTTVALTSRILDTQQKERFQITLGQILYHKDRQVQLTTTQTDEQSQSPVVLQAASNLSKGITVSSGLSWDSQRNVLEDSNVVVGSKESADALWSVAYRYRKATPSDDRIQQTQIAFRRRVTGFWHVINSWNYDSENSRTLEQVSGFQYEDCCWRTDLIYHRRIQSSVDLATQVGNKYAFLLQFEAKGLGAVSGRVSSLLQRTIPGL